MGNKYGVTQMAIVFIFGTRIYTLDYKNKIHIPISKKKWYLNSSEDYWHESTQSYKTWIRDFQNSFKLNKF